MIVSLGQTNGQKLKSPRIPKGSGSTASPQESMACNKEALKGPAHPMQASGPKPSPTFGTQGAITIVRSLYVCGYRVRPTTCDESVSVHKKSPHKKTHRLATVAGCHGATHVRVIMHLQHHGVTKEVTLHLPLFCRSTLTQPVSCPLQVHHLHSKQCAHKVIFLAVRKWRALLDKPAGCTMCCVPVGRQPNKSSAHWPVPQQQG